MMAVRASAAVTLCTVRDVQATYRFYKLQSSTAAVPAIPTSIGTLPPSGWVSTEPSYTSGSTNSLYTVDLTIFTDDTFNYSAVSLSSSYEAAKAAYNKAVAAANAASGAQTTADGKNTVFRQTSAPTTTGRVTGDVWFDTDDGNRIYTWNGSAWASTQMGSSAIADLSIVDAKIANGTISNGKIANLDAGKITTGTLSADRIAAGSLVIGKLNSGLQTTINTTSSTANAALTNANKAQADIDGLEVGGRNLLPNTNELDKWVKELTVTVEKQSNGYYKINSSMEAVSRMGIYLNLNVESETTYTLSCLYYGNGNSSKPSLSIGGENFGGSFGPDPTDNPQKAVKTFNTGQYTKIRVYLPSKTPQSSGYSAYYKYPKLEKGNKPTDWTPAPEDVDASIAENSIANWCYNNDKTYINGGKLYTGTVTATQIAASTITGNKIAGTTITASNLAAGAVTTDKLDANAVTAAKIAAGTITASQIAGSTITGSKIAAGTISATNLATDSVTSDKIVAGNITTEKLAAKSVTANNMAANSITASNAALADASIVNAKIVDIDAGKIKTGYISADRIEGGSIVIGKLNSGLQTTINTASSTATTANHKADEAKSGLDSLSKNVSENYTNTSMMNATFEDIRQDLSAASIANWCWQNNLTYIDGGKIYAKSVTSQAIDVDNLSAISANLGTVTTGVIQSPNYASGGDGVELDFRDSNNNGLSVRSNTKNTMLKIDADGTRVYSNRDLQNPVAQFVDTGVDVNHVNANSAIIAGMQMTKVGSEVWITSII